MSHFKDEYSTPPPKKGGGWENIMYIKFKNITHLSFLDT